MHMESIHEIYMSGYISYEEVQKRQELHNKVLSKQTEDANNGNYQKRKCAGCDWGNPFSKHDARTGMCEVCTTDIEARREFISFKKIENRIRHYREYIDWLVALPAVIFRDTDKIEFFLTYESFCKLGAFEGNNMTEGQWKRWGQLCDSWFVPTYKLLNREYAMREA